MPQIIGANVDTKSVATSWVDARGKKTTTRIDNVENAATAAEALAVQNAIGALSNAAIFATSYQEEQTASIPASTAYDEAESSVTTGANLTFQNTVTLVVKNVRVPAISILHLDSSMNFVKLPADDALVSTAVTAILALLGTSWVYIRGTVSTRARGAVQGGELPIVAEPA
jgi:hypothetical protein